MFNFKASTKLSYDSLLLGNLKSQINCKKDSPLYSKHQEKMSQGARQDDNQENSIGSTTEDQGKGQTICQQHGTPEKQV